MNRSRLKARSVLAVAAAAAVAFIGSAAFATTAQAAVPVTPGDGWHQFVSSGTIGGTSVAGPYNFSSDSISKVSVTDAFCKGDQFTVLDAGTVLGDTSEVPNEFPACSSSGFIILPPAVRAEAAMADALQSHGVFYLAPGTHAVDFATKALWSNIGVGAGAFFRVDEVTVTTADCTHDGWQQYGSVFKNQGDCVSFVATQGRNQPAAS